jgi:hypothetical protein
VLAFFADNEAWLEKVLTQGKRARTLNFTGSARDAARMVEGALEGAMLVARPFGDMSRFETAAAWLLSTLTTR